MNSIKTILISLAASIVAGTPATRADEMSDLVAAVAASIEPQQPPTPLKGELRIWSPESKAAVRLKEDKSMVNILEGILISMQRDSRRLNNNDYQPIIKNSAPTSGGWEAFPFFRPVPGPVTSRFGWRQAFHRVHHGIDLALQIGDTVRCAVSGTVSLISYDHDGYGHYVMLSNKDGMETLYGHLQYPLVAQGQYIYAGMPIGIGGDTGNSTGPHLHFEARLSGVAVDPLILFDFYGINQYLYATESPEAATPKTPTYSHQQKSLKQESTYIVRAGDTAESVARQAGISVMRLRQLNMLSDGAPLPLGRMLKLR